MDVVISQKEAARRLQVSPETIANMVKDGRLQGREKARGTGLGVSRDEVEVLEVEKFGPYVLCLRCFAPTTREESRRRHKFHGRCHCGGELRGLPRDD